MSVGVGGAHAGNAGSNGAAAAPSAGTTGVAGLAGSAAGAAAGGGGAASGGGGGVPAAGGEDAAGAGGAVDLSEYECDAYPLGECLDGASGESYACCPLVGNARCLTGFRTSDGDDFRCGNNSCACDAEVFYTACYGTRNQCQTKDCETVWQHRHVHQGEYPGAAFNPYSGQISLDSPGCGTIGIGVDNHRVGSFLVNGIDDCWRRGTTVTSQFLLDGASDTLGLETAAQTTPPFQGFAARLELDVHRVSWTNDSLSFDVTWRAVACQ